LHHLCTVRFPSNLKMLPCTFGGGLNTALFVRSQ
jgi:hypothetical protein